MDLEEDSCLKLIEDANEKKIIEMSELSKKSDEHVVDVTDPKQDIIEKCTGILGKWHIWVFILACILKIPIAWYQLNIVFLAPNVQYWCTEDENVERCSDECVSHTFDNTTFIRTIVSEWDLVCNREYLKTLAQSLTMAGLLCGNFTFGYLSDRYGRRRTLLFAILIQCTSGTLTAFCPWLAGFLVLRFLVGFSLGGTTVTSFVVVMETVGVKWRTLLALLYQVPFNLGQMLLPVISYYLRDWRQFQLAMSAPTMLLIAYYWLLPESPRWQLAVGKKDAAVKTLEKAAKMNKLSTKNIENDVTNYLQIKSHPTKPEIKKATFIDLFRTPIIRMYTLILWISWFSCGCTFFGGSQFVGQLGGNIFFNVALSALIQIPGALFVCWSIQAWGRKGSMIFGNGLAGIAMFATGLAPDHPSWIKPVLASIGLSGLNTSFATVYVYAGEIFPTVVRNLGIGTASTCARFGSMVAPFIADSFAEGRRSIPPFIFGLMMLLSALLCYKLPETYNCKLPETIEEVEQIDKKKKSESNKK